MNKSDRVPTGHTVEQYIRPKMKVITSHVRIAPMACAGGQNYLRFFRHNRHRMHLRPDEKVGNSGDKEKYRQKYAEYPYLSHFVISSFTAALLLFLLLAEHCLLLTLHLFKTRHEAGFLTRFL